MEDLDVKLENRNFEKNMCDEMKSDDREINGIRIACILSLSLSLYLSGDSYFFENIGSC
jgi:hypothetical protein